MSEIGSIEIHGEQFALVPEEVWRPMEHLLTNALSASDGSANADDPPIPDFIKIAIAAGESPLRAWRIFRGVPESRLAKLVGISPSYLRMIELGERVGNAKAWDGISNVLGVSRNLLMTCPAGLIRQPCAEDAVPHQDVSDAMKARVQSRANEHNTSLLRAWRLELELTEASAADRMGISKRSYCELEQRLRHRVSTLYRASRAFGIPLEALLYQSKGLAQAIPHLAGPAEKQH